MCCINFSYLFLQLFIPIFAKFNLDEVRILNDGAYVFSYVPDLGVFGCLDSQKWGFGELCQSSCYFRLSASSRALNHQIFGCDLAFNIIRKTFSPPPVSKRYGDCLLRFGLPNNKPIEVLDDLGRRKFSLIQHNSLEEFFSGCLLQGILDILVGVGEEITILLLDKTSFNFFEQRLGIACWGEEQSEHFSFVFIIGLS